ncbi:transcriptional regulator, TrmB [Beutenbergia cavernae DSM 12333]|uniref:Transcriptional regulator, TrmB n=1 Tax=Beutenbergia cavernae (strain ATCC BAA-8 / DSM 12333 / CCUG 43141 / JCM 11478 / NBRC 16432 / NCIMB 13614 / HKI 0122) TaxID=471853 RepID=C5C4W9_BEUC1|nr:MarR family transcriptional regulator [Beutenbergia cavernae]ACQ80097.1 transcriptional regulator, TrmB [Beutenbergia cavernae DSM 12333]
MTRDQDDTSALYRTYLAAVVAYHQAAGARLGLGATDYQAHNLLALEGAMTTGELARLLGLSPSATTRVVDRLVERGLAEREVDAEDRRRSVVVPTSARPAGLDDQLAQVRELVAPAFAGLDARGQEVLRDYFARATDGFREATRRLAV